MRETMTRHNDTVVITEIQTKKTDNRGTALKRSEETTSEGLTLVYMEVLSLSEC